MNNSPFTVVSKVSIRPSKIVFYEQFFRNSQEEKTPPRNLTAVKNESSQLIANLYENETISHLPLPQPSTQNLCLEKKKQVQPNKHGFEISKKASENIKEKISWLYTLAKRRVKTSPRTKKVFYFKMNFVTLTLPSLQKHDSATLTAELLNQFLTECKKRYDLQNYVWRLEFQNNGNVHYHLATDCYLNYDYAIAIWNRCLDKLGYIDDYCEKFSKMGFKEYYKNYNNGGKTSLATLKKRYRKGVKSGWRSPKTVDIKSVDSDKNIAFYISKYITKNSSSGLNPIVAKRENAETNLRLWFCSRSLSKLKKIVYFIDATDSLVDDFYKELGKIVTKFFDYCKVQYYNYTEQSNAFKRKSWDLFTRYSRESGYVPSW